MRISFTYHSMTTGEVSHREGRVVALGRAQNGRHYIRLVEHVGSDGYDSDGIQPMEPKTFTVQNMSNIVSFPDETPKAAPILTEPVNYDIQILTTLREIRDTLKLRQEMYK